MARNTKLVNGESQSQKTGNARNRNKVVTARMSNTRKCVIFGVEIHRATVSIAKFGLESGAKAVSVARRIDTLGLEEVADGVVGNVFLVRQFGCFVDLRFSVR